MDGLQWVEKILTSQGPLWALFGVFIYYLPSVVKSHLDTLDKLSASYGRLVVAYEKLAKGGSVAAPGDDSEPRPLA
jgi:O-methyltransferase involved in polyketide biosynthesis